MTVVTPPRSSSAIEKSTQARPASSSWAALRTGSISKRPEYQNCGLPRASMNERSSGEPRRWAWVEMSPGVTTRSAASTVSSTVPSKRGPTWRMRSPSSTTTPFRSSRWPRPSKAMTAPARIAVRRVALMTGLRLHDSGRPCQSPAGSACQPPVNAVSAWVVGTHQGRVAMPRQIKVAAAQMGPNNEGTPREEIVERMLALLELAIRDGVEVVAYPEMALTTYFPQKIRPHFEQFFETAL